MKKFRASECYLKEVPKSEEKSFLNENHYQGYIASRWCKGLYYKDELLILMSFGIPRYNKRYDWELLRLASKKDCCIYGGASKIFKNFLESENGSIISYCNKSLFSGNVYDRLGFSLLANCKSYHYEKDGKSYHRSNFQRWKLQEKYPEYGPEYTEKEIMKLLGYSRVEEIQAAYVYGNSWYIYRTTNLINGKTYIGQHLDRGDFYLGSGTALKRAIAKYGKENFKKEIIKDNIQSQKEADEEETKYIDREKAIGKAEYNILVGRRTPHRIFTTEETRRRIAESRLGDKNPTKKQDVKDKISTTLKKYYSNKHGTSYPLISTSYNKWVEFIIKQFYTTKKKPGCQTEESRRKSRDSHKGKTPWNKGKKCTGIGGRHKDLNAQYQYAIAWQIANLLGYSASSACFQKYWKSF